jgi:two-component system sensor histidine kinase CreC
VDHLLQLASLEAAGRLKQPQALSLTELLAGELQALAPQLGARRVTPVATLPQATVAGDAFLLRQALRNILQNAIDFTAADGAITLQLQPVDRSWQLHIANDGPPVPDYALPRLFERFYSLPRPHGPKSSGLGLALTRTIVQLHGGDITLANQPPGVCVTLQLPAADAANPLARVLG